MMEIEFTLQDEYIELIKLIKAAGIASTGGMAKILVEHNLVSVDGQPESRRRRKIRKGQTVAVEGDLIRVL